MERLATFEKGRLTVGDRGLQRCLPFSVGQRPPPGAWLNAGSDLPHASRRRGDMPNAQHQKALAAGFGVVDAT